MKLRIGTRGSALALWQANEVARLLGERGHETELVRIQTTGDRRQDVALADVGGKGLFIKELEDALARGAIDLAVHSLKDVPSIVPEEFVLAAFLARADARDVCIGRLAPGGKVGTSSPRRRAQLLARHPALVVEPIRGNVDTRLAKQRSGEFDAVVLAAAGLHRLGRESEITSYFTLDEMIPAAGQGIVAIETLAASPSVREAVAAINDAASEMAARCERGVLQQFGTRLDCYSPIAVHATAENGEITIRGFYDGVWTVRRGRDEKALIEQVARDLGGPGSTDRDSADEDVGAPRSTAGGAPTSSSAPLVPKTGIVYLVGAGPGDPSLLTLRAAELLASADVVAVDALVSQEIADRIPKSARVIYVGKRASAHAVPQDQINRILVEEAKKGQRVVRLKGGDPFVFGRGGEEAEDLAAAGVPFEIVPGISSATAGPAYAGIPVTHRDHATSLTIVTGHESDESTGIRWEALAKLDGTIVFLMGFGNLPMIVRKLTEHGVPADRPVAVISKATTRRQRTVAGTLEDIESRVGDATLETPALIVVGGVVSLRETIGWFETKPLFGRRIVVTRAREQASELKRLLEEAGAEVLQFPTIEIAPPQSFESLDRVIDAIAGYDWIVFTSANGVAHFFDRLARTSRDARALAKARVAAVGAATADALRARGIVPDLVPERFLSAALVPHLPDDQRGLRTAVVRAEEGRGEIIDELRRRGGEVDLAIAYRNVPAESDLALLRSLIESDAIDVVTFASASSAENFFARISGEERDRLSKRALYASIGPTTSEAIRRHARQPDIEAPNATLEALRDAIVARMGG